MLRKIGENFCRLVFVVCGFSKPAMLRQAFAVALFFAVTSSFAQNVSFNATVSKKRVNLSGNFQITFKLENADGSNFKPPAFSDFIVISGPFQSTGMEIINGRMSRSYSISYNLKPKKEGTFTIGAATITAGGKALSSNSVAVEVVADGAKDPNQPQDQTGDAYAQISASVFLRLLVDKKEVYLGEQVTVSYKLYCKLPISNPQPTKAPSYTGFWSQDLDLPENIELTPEVYDGVQYNAAVIKKTALFPQRSGELEIDPLELQLYVRMRYFNGFFYVNQDYPYTFSSNTAKIKAKPLPTAGTPSNFNGAVGDFGMEVVLNKTETQPDEPVALKINITGTGNIKMLDVPTISLPPDLEVFDPKVSEKISKTGTISGTRTYDYLIIPRRGGQFKIPPVEFSYFDLDRQQYVVHQSPEYVINVTGEGSKSTPSVTGITKEEVELLGEDIRYIKGETTLKKQGEFLLASWLFAGLYVAPFLLFGLLLVYKKREDKLSGNVALLKNKRANKEAVRRLKKAKQFLSEQNRKPFFDEISRAIWGYFGDKLSIDQATLSREQVQKVLTDKNISGEVIQRIFKILDDAEMALFAPTSDGEMNKVYDEATEVISKLDSEL